MGVRDMAQELVTTDHGPASSPLPGATDEVQEEHEEVLERTDWSTERAGQSLVDQGIGIMVAVIVVGAVAIPVVQDVVSTTNVTGMAGNILEYVTLALALGLFVAAISIVR